MSIFNRQIEMMPRDQFVINIEGDAHWSFDYCAIGKLQIVISSFLIRERVTVALFSLTRNLSAIDAANECADIPGMNSAFTSGIIFLNARIR